MHLLTDAAASGPRGYSEHLRVPDLSVGSVVLAAGAVDGQQPHTEDEVYVILEGRSRFTAGDATRDVGPGDTLFVAATVPHRFHDIIETLRVIVVFGPAEGSRAPPADRAARRSAGLATWRPARFERQPDARTRLTRSANASARSALVPSSSWRNRT